MQKTYTIADFKTRQGRVAFTQNAAHIDFALLNRMEPENPDSPADQFNARQDKASFALSMSVYKSLGIPAQKDIELPSGKKFTVAELAKMDEMESRRSYLHVHHEFERAFSTRQSVRELGEILEGRKAIDVPYFRLAIETYPVEATLVRLELSNPTLTLDEEIYNGMRDMVLRTLSLTQYSDGQGNTRTVPLIGAQEGPREPPLSTAQLQTLIDFWDVLDDAEGDIFHIFHEKFGVTPANRPG